MSNQLEGTFPPGAKGTAPVSSGTATPKVRKQSVTPSPSDKGNSGKGKG